MPTPPPPARFRSALSAVLAFAALFGSGVCDRAVGEVVGADFAGVSLLAPTDEAPWREEIEGRLNFAVDPDDERNAIVADIALAPRNGDGRVRFSADFRLTLPADAQGRRGGVEALWAEIPNRSGQSRERDFLVSQGFAVLEIGWEFDLPPRRGRFGIEVPVARAPDGSPIRGVVEAVFVLPERTERHRVADLEVYPPADPEGPDSVLRARPRAAFPGGEEIPRDRWRIEDGDLVLEGGFEPGRTYKCTSDRKKV